MNNSTNKNTINILQQLFFPFIVLIIWELSVRLQLFPPSLSATPSAIIKTAVNGIFEGNLIKHAAISITRLVVGVTLGIIFGLVLGMIAALNRTLDSMLSPLIRFIAPIPAVVWLPFAVMFFGTGELYKISLPYFITFLLVYIQTLEGVRNVSIKYIEVARIYEKSRIEIIRKILAPSALPSVVTGVKVALAISWIAIYIVEFSSANPKLGGLGWFIADAREVGRVEEQFAGALILGILGFVTDALIDRWQKKQLKWTTRIDVNK
jgi:sulfonate transport system permease protein